MSLFWITLFILVFVYLFITSYREYFKVLAFNSTQMPTDSISLYNEESKLIDSLLTQGGPTIEQSNMNILPFYELKRFPYLQLFQDVTLNFLSKAFQKSEQLKGKLSTIKEPGIYDVMYNELEGLYSFKIDIRNSVKNFVRTFQVLVLMKDIPKILSINLILLKSESSAKPTLQNVVEFYNLNNKMGLFNSE